jgi:hypothetical protein
LHDHHLLTVRSFDLYTEGIDNIDDYNRSNYEMLTRLNRMSNSKGSASTSASRQFGPRTSPYGRAFQHNFPDPLFGASANAAAISPRPLNRNEGRLTPGGQYESDQRATMRQFSFATAPESSVEPLLPYARLEPTSFHHSLPNIHYQQPDDQSDPFDDDNVSLHQSLPSIALSQHGAMPEPYNNNNKMPKVKSMEPIPFHRINLKGRPKEADDPSNTTKKAAALPEETISAASTNSTRLSRDLIECLDKMTYHTIHDANNPFEPIPLTPRQEREIAARRQRQRQQLQQQQQQQLLTLKPMEELSSESFPSGEAEPMDESEQIDEFAEG